MKFAESFFFGIVAALGALICEVTVYIGISTYTNSISTVTFFDIFSLPQFIVAAAFIEELLKYITISQRKELVSQKKSLMLHALFIGFGFFSIEFLLLSASRTSLSAIQLLAEIGIIHIGTSGIIGYFASTGSPKKISVFLPAILLTAILHSLYNLLALNRALVESFMIFAVLGTIIILNIIFYFRRETALAQD
jgi:hypothetical protein